MIFTFERLILCYLAFCDAISYETASLASSADFSMV